LNFPLGTLAPTEDRAARGAPAPLLRVAHVCSEPFYGGAFRRVLRLVPALRRARVDCALLCSSASRLALAGAELGVDVEELQPRRVFDPRALVGPLRALRRLGADVVHVHEDSAMPLVGLAARLAGVPVVRTYESIEAPNPLASAFVRRAIATTPAVLGRLTRATFRADRALEIPDGVDVDALTARAARSVTRGAEGTQDDDFVLLSLASLEDDRGHDVLLLALARLAESGLRPVLWLAGDGPRLVELDRLRRELGLVGSTRFLGRRTNVADLIDACDVVVYPAVTAHSGVGVLEAMAMGRPVVATDLGGPSRSVVPDETGLLVAPGDPLALSEALRALLVDSALVRRLGAAGPARVASRFTIETAARAHLEVYQAAAGVAAHP
jgi:glycosyltransferase involved in cell wall biosynthesis